jgi:hypothetical protein
MLPERERTVVTADTGMMRAGMLPLSAAHDARISQCAVDFTRHQVRSTA